MTVDELNQRLEAAVSATIRVMVDLYADELPQLEPAKKKGKWLKRTDKTQKLYGWYQCSQCGSIIGKPVNYCSECGSYNGGTE